MPPSATPPSPDAPVVKHLGWVLRQRREAMALTRERLSEVLGYGVTVIRDVECGRYHADLRHYLAKWKQVFGLDDELHALWQQARAQQAARRQQSILAVQSTCLPANITNAAAPAGDRIGADIETEPNQWELAEALTRSSVSLTALEYLEQVVQSYAARYPSSSPDMLISAVNMQLRRLHEVLGQPQSLRVRRRAVQLIGMLSGIRGNLLLDFGREYEAVESFAVGKLAGTEAEDPDLIAWVLATESIGPYFAGHYHHAVQLLDEAAQRVTHQASARRRAWIAALGARGYATLGDAEHALAKLDTAYAALGAAEAPHGADFFDEVRLEGIAGTSYLLLRDTVRAQQTLTAARAQRAASDLKGRALLTLDLAACRLLEDEGEESCQLIEEALKVAGSSIVEPIRIRARAVRASVGHSAGRDALARVDLRLAEPAR